MNDRLSNRAIINPMGEAIAQYTFGGEMGETRLDPYTPKTLEGLQNLRDFSPLAVLTLLTDPKPGTIVRIGVSDHEGEIPAVVFSDGPSFTNYCRARRIKGLIVVVGAVEWLPVSLQQDLKKFFLELGGKVDSSDRQVWIVDQSTKNISRRPQDDYTKDRLKAKREIIRQMGLSCQEADYRCGKQSGYFTARLHPYKPKLFGRD